jgi:hypothetical protein
MTQSLASWETVLYGSLWREDLSRRQRNSQYKKPLTGRSNILATVHQNTQIVIDATQKDCHKSTTTQQWNADVPESSNHTEVSVHCCHGKPRVASSRTLLSNLVCLYVLATSLYRFWIGEFCHCCSQRLAGSEWPSRRREWTATAGPVAPIPCQ